MQVPRDVSRRMLEAAEQTPIVDIHERLVPESKRVGQRFDLLSWFLAYAGTEVQALGLARPDLALLANTNADPEQRWTLFSTYWPYLRTTGVGRVVLRMAWDLFGIAELDERTWKDISAKLWKISEPGFYQKLFAEKANLHKVLVDNQVDAGSLSCHLVCNYEHVLSMSTRARLDALVKRLDEP